MVNEGLKKSEHAFWWECSLEQQLQKTVWRFLNNLKIELPYESASPLPGVCQKKNENTS